MESSNCSKPTTIISGRSNSVNANIPGHNMPRGAGLTFDICYESVDERSTPMIFLLNPLAPIGNASPLISMICSKPGNVRQRTDRIGELFHNAAISLFVCHANLHSLATL
jgi:hypothetical protein